MLGGRAPLPGVPALSLLDVHALDEAAAQCVDVDHTRVGDRAAVERADDLVHVDGDTPAVARREAKRLDARIDRRELTGPLRTQRVVAVDTSTLDRVRPIDIRVHEGEGGLSAARVKRLVGATQAMLEILGHGLRS
jgi:hypothetical protein